MGFRTTLARLRFRPAPLVALAGVALSVTAFVQVWDLTRPAPGVGHDSVDFLAAASSLRSGDGLTIPYPSYNEPPPRRFVGADAVAMTNFPPLLPALIAATGFLTAQPVLNAARLLNAFALALCVVLAGILVWRRTRDPVWAIFAMAAIFFQPVIVAVTATVWSEPIASALLLGGVLALTEYLARPRAWPLVIAGLIAGAAVLERYAAIALFLTGLLTLWAARRPVRDALVFSALALVPVIAWSIHVGGASGARELGWHPPPWSTFGALFETGYHWLSPLAAVRVLVLGALVGLLVFAIRLPVWCPRRTAVGQLAVMGAVPVFYVLALLAASTAFDLVTRNEMAVAAGNQRFLTPVYVLGVPFVACALAISFRRLRPAFRTVGSAVVLGLCLASLLRAPGLEAGVPAAFVYTAPPFRDSPTVALVRRLPPGDLLVTNTPDFVWLRTHRIAVPMPRTYISVTGKPNLQYHAELSAINAAVDGGRRGWLAFWTFVGRPYLPTIAEVRGSLRLRLASATADGSVYEILPQAARSISSIR